jgi:hypothetical protein
LRRLSVLLSLGIGLGTGLGAALAQTPSAPARIYSCTLPDGRKLTSDRPIPECLSREQRLLRRDGSTQSVMPPAMSPEERAAAELAAREEAAARAAQRDNARHDRNLLARYPRKERHDVARRAALDDIVKATLASEARLQELAKERKVLDDEAEFYKARMLPAKLKQSIDNNQATVEAQKLFINQQSEEKARVNRRFDVELERLKKLWSGAAPGSLGPPPSGREGPEGSLGKGDAGAAPAGLKSPKPASS